MKTFQELRKMLEEEGVLLSAISNGEHYSIDSLRTMRCEGDFHHKLFVVRHDKEFFEDSISYMAEEGSLSPAQTKAIIERSCNGVPFQLFIVSDIDAAEKAVKEFLK